MLVACAASADRSAVKKKSFLSIILALIYSLVMAISNPDKEGFRKKTFAAASPSLA